MAYSTTVPEVADENTSVIALPYPLPEVVDIEKPVGEVISTAAPSPSDSVNVTLPSADGPDPS